MVSIRKYAISSPRGTVKRVCFVTNKTARSAATVRAAALVQVEPEEKKYTHVHQFKQTGLFGAWLNDPSRPGTKERLFFGSHLTGYLAARAQDRATLKYRASAENPENVKLTFKEEDYALDEELRDTLKNEEFGDLLRSESRPTYKKMEQTPLLRYFMEEERILGHLPSGVPNEGKAKKVTPLEQYLTDVISKREGNPQVPDLSFLRKLNERLSGKLEALYLNLINDRVHNVHPAAAAPIAEPTDQGPKKEKRNGPPRQELRFLPMKCRNVAALNEPGALRSSASVPSGSKPLATPVSTVVAAGKPKSAKEKFEVVVVWFTQRPNSKIRRRLGSRFVTEFEFMAPGAARSKLQYKLQKSLRVVTPGTARSKLQYKLQKVNITRSPEPSQTATLPAQVEEPMRDVEEPMPEVEEPMSQAKDKVPEEEEMVPEVEEPMPEVQEKDSRKNNCSLFMLAAVAAEEV